MNPPLPVKSFWRWGIAALVLVIPLLVSPMVLLGLVAVAPEGVLDLSTLVAVVSDPANIELARYTLVKAEASTVFALLIGLPAAHVIAHVRFPGRRTVRMLLTLPIVLPPLVVALGFRELLVAAGREETGAVPVLLAHTCFGVAIVVRIMAGAWAHLDPRHEEAARMLGASRLHAFASITLPALLPALLSAIALVFAFAFTSFGVVLVLGGGKDTIEMAVYRIALNPESASIAATLGLLQLAVTIPLLGLYAGAQRYLTARAADADARTIAAPDLVARAHRRAAGARGDGRPRRRADRGGDPRSDDDQWRAHHHVLRRADDPRRGRAVADGRSALEHPDRCGLRDPRHLRRRDARHRGGTCEARRDGDPRCAIPATASTPRCHDRVRLPDSRGRTTRPYSVPQAYAILLAAHAMIVAPFALRAVLGPARAADPREREAAVTLGASSGRAWRVIEWPLLRRAMIYGGALAFAMSLGETGATLLLARPEFSPIPVLIARALGEPSAAATGAALALGTMLMGLAVVAFVIIERLRPRDVGEF